MSVCLAPLSLHEALALPKCKQGTAELLNIKGCSFCRAALARLSTNVNVGTLLQGCARKQEGLAKLKGNGAFQREL